MSTFSGRFEEIPGISADRFDGENLNSDVFFLSHCHYDHMEGLSDCSFQDKLKETNRFIYVSHVTKAILKQLYPYITDQIVDLGFDVAPTAIRLKNGKSVLVNLIPSGHCPGSVMFLFEYEGKRILYTGDYRISKRDLENMKVFYDSFGEIKKIHSIHLDTTFFLKDYEKFPSRRESLDAVCKLIEDWIKIGEKYIVELITPANYGYEYAFIEISKRFKMPIHVSQRAYEFYSLVPEMDEAVTLDGTKTKIHCTCGPRREICIPDKEQVDYEIRNIKMSAYAWKNKDLKEGITASWNPNYHCVCYSTHASFEEGVNLIKFLNPDKVHRSVKYAKNAGEKNKPEEIKKDEEIKNNIKVLLSSVETNKLKKKIGDGHELSSSEEIEEQEKKRPKLFNIDQIEEMEKTDVSQKNDEIFDDLFESALESPPKFE